MLMQPTLLEKRERKNLRTLLCSIYARTHGGSEDEQPWELDWKISRWDVIRGCPSNFRTTTFLDHRLWSHMNGTPRLSYFSPFSATRVSHNAHLTHDPVHPTLHCSVRSPSLGGITRDTTPSVLGVGELFGLGPSPLCCTLGWVLVIVIMPDF